MKRTKYYWKRYIIQKNIKLWLGTLKVGKSCGRNAKNVAEVISAWDETIGNIRKLVSPL